MLELWFAGLYNVRDISKSWLVINSRKHFIAYQVALIYTQTRRWFSLKNFNTEGACIPSLHYMVNIDQTLLQIRSLIGKGKYFTINRARQFGKTTTLAQIRTRYNKEYVILSLDFQGIGNAGFSSEEAFA